MFIQENAFENVVCKMAAIDTETYIKRQLYLCAFRGVCCLLYAGFYISGCYWNWYILENYLSPK